MYLSAQIRTETEEQKQAVADGIVAFKAAVEKASSYVLFNEQEVDPVTIVWTIEDIREHLINNCDIDESKITDEICAEILSGVSESLEDISVSRGWDVISSNMTDELFKEHGLID